MTVGLFFGSFNPIHMGHLMLAQYILNSASVDEVWFVVSPQNPFKKQEDLVGAEHRVEMVRIAVEGNVKMRVCDIELSLPTPSYTIDTLRALTKKYPDRQFVVVMGGDNLVGLSKWKEYDELVSNYSFIVYPRLGNELNVPQGVRVEIVEAPYIEISSTMLRRWIKEGKSVEYYTKDEVIVYFSQNNLY